MIFFLLFSSVTLSLPAKNNVSITKTVNFVPLGPFCPFQKGSWPSTPKFFVSLLILSPGNSSYFLTCFHPVGGAEGETAGWADSQTSPRYTRLLLHTHIVPTHPIRTTRRTHLPPPSLTPPLSHPSLSPPHCINLTRQYAKPEILFVCFCVCLFVCSFWVVCHFILTS